MDFIARKIDCELYVSMDQVNRAIEEKNAEIESIKAENESLKAKLENVQATAYAECLEEDWDDPSGATYSYREIKEETR